MTIGGQEPGMILHSNLTCKTTELSNSILYQPGGTKVVLSQTMAPSVIGTGEDHAD